MSYQDDPDARADAQQYKENRREMFSQLEEQRAEQRWWEENDKKKAELPPLDFAPDPMHRGNTRRIIDGIVTFYLAGFAFFFLYSVAMIFMLVCASTPKSPTSRTITVSSHSLTAGPLPVSKATTPPKSIEAK